MLHEQTVEGRCQVLQRGHARLSRCDHELEKEALSSADALMPRREARRLFRARAADSPDVSELVELEARIRGGYVEPSTLSCPSLHKTLERLMNDPDNSLVPEASEQLFFLMYSGVCNLGTGDTSLEACSQTRTQYKLHVRLHNDVHRYI